MLDPQEEAKFDELKAKCRELKVPAPPEIMIGLKVHEGGVLTFDDVQRGHSWTRNAWNLNLQGWWCHPYSVGNTYAAGSSANKTILADISTYYGDYIANQINVGTGDTASSINDYMLVAKIASGNAAGQLLASAWVKGTPSYNAGTHIWSWLFSQIFNNNSGGSITVKETALYNSVYLFLTERSVLSPTVAVANGAQLTVTYSISMDFSAID
jgi:hypothetical protein